MKPTNTTKTIDDTEFKWICDNDSDTCTEEEPCQSCCDHSDLCKGICLTCGYDRRGEMLADRIDRALDWDKDNS
jgi:hypothetical protein